MRPTSKARSFLQQNEIFLASRTAQPKLVEQKTLVSIKRELSSSFIRRQPDLQLDTCVIELFAAACDKLLNKLEIIVLLV